MIRTIDLNQSMLAGWDRLSQHLEFHTQRQTLIAANLANLDTPAYRARDLTFNETMTVQLERGKTARHVDFDAQVVTADDVVPDQDGNTVSLEGQMAKMTANGLRYNTITELLGRQIGMVRYAATDGNR